MSRVKMAFDVSQATASGGLALGLTLKTFDLFRSCNKFKSCFVKWRCLVSLFTFFRTPNQLELANLEFSHKTNAVTKNNRWAHEELCFWQFFILNFHTTYYLNSFDNLEFVSFFWKIGRLSHLSFLRSVQQRPDKYPLTFTSPDLLRGGIRGCPVLLHHDVG